MAISTRQVKNKRDSNGVLTMRKLCDERGNVYFGVDEDIRQRLQARLMRAILTFRVE